MKKPTKRQTAPPLVTVETLVETLATTQLHPNAYNPNAMTTEAFDELVAEVRHLGRLPKPIVVRRNEAGFVIVDGEHGWRAAQAVGLEQIPCEVIAADDFEAMRQTYKRNQHGTHNPVRLGQMFQQMMTDRALSQRALAAEIEVSEGTVRNALIYAEAAALRNGYAAAKKKVVVETLSVRQVRAYVLLPPAIGNLWLDCDASLAAIYECKSERDVELFGGESPDGLKDMATHYARREQTELVPYLKSVWSPESFRKAMKQLDEWARWEGLWCICGFTRQDVRPYTRHYFSGAWVVRDHSSMDSALDLIIDTTGTERKNEHGQVCGYIRGTKPRLHLTPDEFETVVLASRSISECNQHLAALVFAKTGVEPGRNNRRKLQEVELQIAKPAYLKGSKLPIDVQHALWLAHGWTNNSFLVARAPSSLSLDAAKRELAQCAHIPREGNQSLQEAIDRQLRRYYDRAVTREQVETVTEAEMVEAIARRMPIYDTEKPSDREAIAVMAATLMHLTRPELLCLFKYSEALDSIKMLGYLTEALAGR